MQLNLTTTTPTGRRRTDPSTWDHATVWRPATAVWGRGLQRDNARKAGEALGKDENT
jgi:hypothetical protein